MPSTFSTLITVPLPASLDPGQVLAALQTYEAIIKSQPFVVSLERQPVDVVEIISDPFFKTDGSHVQRFRCVEKIEIFPFPVAPIKKSVAVDVIFQSFPSGTRARADAVGGVRIYSHYFVRRRPQAVAPWHSQPPGSAGPGSSGTGAADEIEWELAEHATVECGAIIKPLVSRKFEEAHRGILKGIVEYIQREMPASPPRPVQDQRLQQQFYGQPPPTPPTPSEKSMYSAPGESDQLRPVSLRTALNGAMSQPAVPPGYSSLRHPVPSGTHPSELPAL